MKQDNRSPRLAESGDHVIAWIVATGLLSFAAAVSLSFAPAALVGSVAIITTGAIVLRRHRNGRRQVAFAPTFSERDQLVLWLVRIFPLAIAIGVQSRRLSVLALSVIALAALPVARRNGAHVHPIASPLALGFALFLMTSAFTWLVNPATRYVCIILASFIALVLAILRLSPSARARTMSALHDGIGIYLVSSVFLYYVAGLRSPADLARVHQVLSAASAFGTRVTFPLSPSISPPPALAAAFLVGVAAGLPHASGLVRAFRAVAVACGIVVLLASNGRTGTAVCLGVIAAIIWAPIALERLAPYIALGGICLPLLVQSISASVSAFLSAFIPYFDRGVSGSEATQFGGRSPIWKTAISAFGHQDPLHQLFGYGANGHITSGAASQYARYLSGFLRTPALGHPHSTALQVLFDSGAVGFTLLLFLVARTLIELRNTMRISAPLRSAPSFLGLAMLVTLAGAAATDPLLAPGQHLEVFWVFLLLCASALGLSAHSVVEPPPSADRLVANVRGR